MALGLAQQGMHQIIHHGHSDADAEATADAVRALGTQAIVVKADVTQPAEIDRLFDAVGEHFGRLDVLVNSASTFESGSIADLPLANWQQTLAVNLTAPFLCSQHAVRLMRDGGSIVNMVDLSAFRPVKHFPHHSVSKAGLLMLTEVLAVSLGPAIRVNAIAPGAVLKPDSSTPAGWAKLGDRLPVQATGSADDVVAALVYLVTQPFMTGSVIRVDGGEYLV